MKDCFMENTTNINIPLSRLKMNKIVESTNVLSLDNKEFFSIKMLNSEELSSLNDYNISIKMLSLSPITKEEVRDNFKNLFLVEKNYGVTPTISDKDRIIFIFEGKTNVFLNNESKRMGEGQYISIPANSRLNFARLSTLECKIIEISYKDELVKIAPENNNPIKLAFFSEKYLSQFRVEYNEDFAKEHFLPKEIYQKPYATVKDDPNVKNIITEIYPIIANNFEEQKEREKKQIDNGMLKILRIEKDMHHNTIKLLADYVAERFNAYYHKDDLHCFRYYQDDFIFDKSIKTWNEAYAQNISIYVESLDDISVTSKWPHIDVGPPEMFRAIIFLNDVTEENGATKYLKDFNKEFYSFDMNKIKLFENDKDFIFKIKTRFRLNYFPEILPTRPEDDEYESITGPAGTIVLLSPTSPHFVPPLKKGYRDAVVIALYSNDWTLKKNKELNNVQNKEKQI
jgi:hypothetical protein